ncbi:hypothetical protein [Streptomyces sp. NBC_00842]|uniref:hypothetical protein n=1 Tax=Streptomyces sp. NBC_00842 TaxID=2975848 RepID=UPI00386CBBD5|nr:hypothetical protein OH821_28045 [Streptomyces sp. NBC_00842]
MPALNPGAERRIRDRHGARRGDGRRHPRRAGRPAGCTRTRRDRRENLDPTGSQIVSERVPATLAPLLGNAPAKDLLTRASAEADRTGSPLAAVLGALPEVTAHLADDQITRLLDPEGHTGAAAAPVDRELDGKPPPRNRQA